MLKYWKDAGNPLAPVGDPKFPYVMTTYRLTEHYLAGAMSRWLRGSPSCSRSCSSRSAPSWPQEKGIANLDWVQSLEPARRRSAPRRWSRAGMRPLHHRRQNVHQVGMPWHWGYEGLVTGDSSTS